MVGWPPEWRGWRRWRWRGYLLREALGVLAAGVDAVAGMAALVVEAEARGADGVLMAPGEEGMLEDAGAGAGAGAGLDGEAEGGMASGVAGALGGQSVMVLGTAVMIPGFADT